MRKSKILFVLSCCCFSLFGCNKTPTKRVVLIGVDGAGAFFSETSSPFVNDYFKDKAYTFDCVTCSPTISAQCWTGLITGCKPELTKTTNDSLTMCLHPTQKTVFKKIYEQGNKAKQASIVKWAPLNLGLGDLFINLEKINCESDEQVKNKTIEYIKNNKNFNSLFVHFDSVDEAGHSNGYNTAAQLEQLKVVDSYIQSIYDTLKQNVDMDNTLFIVTSDHGGTGTSHGGASESEYKTFVGVSGPNVLSGQIGPMSIRDIYSIIGHHFGYENESYCDSVVPNNLFEDCNNGRSSITYGE